MNHITGEDRNQMLIFSLEQVVAKDAFVRVIDAFTNAIDLKSFGFKHVEHKEEGRPPYHPGILLKLYLYGYRYGIRSSRKLAREAEINLELMWLLSGQRPKFRTIAYFRKNHADAFRNVFRRFVYLLKEWDLVDGETIAVDSFKIRAQNSLKNNFNQKKIEQHLSYIDQKISEYENLLEQSDKEEEKKAVKAKIRKQQEKKSRYCDLKEKLTDSNQDQISLTDSEAKAVILHRNIVNVGYNVQAAVDAKNKLLVECDTGSVNDTHALADIAIKTKQLLGAEHINILADKGYNTGQQLKQCADNNITTFVSPKASSANKDTGVFPTSDFKYDHKTDTYTCPAGKKLSSNGSLYKHSSKSKKGSYRFKRYATKECANCNIKSQCTKSRANGRAIDRNEYADFIEQNNSRVERYPDYYRKRQQVAEHMFGTFKRQRGFDHTLMKGKINVLGEVSMMFITYNLGRISRIIKQEELIKKLQMFCFLLLNNLFGTNKVYVHSYENNY